MFKRGDLVVTTNPKWTVEGQVIGYVKTMRGTTLWICQQSVNELTGIFVATNGGIKLRVESPITTG